MARYVKNPAGGVHSVPDDFEAPEEWGKKDENWFELAVDEAKAAIAHLFGAEDPAVQQARLTDEREADPADTGVPGPVSLPEPEPQPVDADGNPIPTPTDEGDPSVPAPEAPTDPAADSPTEEPQA
jgi:hypothetical protein